MSETATVKPAPLKPPPRAGGVKPAASAGDNKVAPANGVETKRPVEVPNGDTEKGQLMFKLAPRQKYPYLTFYITT
jgi:hypothetical protein